MEIRARAPLWAAGRQRLDPALWALREIFRGQQRTWPVRSMMDLWVLRCCTRWRARWSAPRPASPPPARPQRTRRSHPAEQYEGVVDTFVW